MTSISLQSLSAYASKRMFLKSAIFVIAFLLVPLFHAYGFTGPKELVRKARVVLEEIQKSPDGGIPEELLSRCYGIAIFPSVYKGGFIFGASYGEGILVARNPETNEWRGPVFLKIGSGSVGWQIGVQSTDLVLVIMNKRGIDALSRDNLTLGGDISVAAGPVGRKLTASTDLTLNAEIYSYSRSKGFFVGISLEGAYLRHDYYANDTYYGSSHTPKEILFYGVVVPPRDARHLLEWLKKYSS